MAGNITYDRDKNPNINSTVIAIVAKADEGSGATPADLLGDNGEVFIEFEGDADESGGATLENIFRVDTLRVTVNVTTGLMQLQGTIVPVLGDGTDAATPVVILVNHPETADAWQAAAGRAQQV